VNNAARFLWRNRQTCKVQILVLAGREGSSPLIRIVKMMTWRGSESRERQEKCCRRDRHTEEEGSRRM